MIDMNSIGLDQFIHDITKQIISVKNRNVGDDYKSLFSVINKINLFEEFEIEVAEDALKFLLGGIVPDLNIFQISAYYGVKGKMYTSGDINLKDIQKNRKIKIEYPEGWEFTISGRRITKENAAKIKKLEK